VVECGSHCSSGVPEHLAFELICAGDRGYWNGGVRFVPAVASMHAPDEYAKTWQGTTVSSGVRNSLELLCFELFLLMLFGQS